MKVRASRECEAEAEAAAAAEAAAEVTVNEVAAWRGGTGSIGGCSGGLLAAAGCGGLLGVAGCGGLLGGSVSMRSRAP